ncbi:chemotaxis protein CheA [Acidaminobacter hydrogenoformans]|uniref:Chemotaxis protein CheA n=1 Tax=Acidaminobacter hydrogenoformans DSM 2784 TaxID=1120920 RepID=A0A1G5RUZ8_9FIRM|nr:chemotaxis protein CheA [Acidaminobacter hydrogenoformans]SCZ77846.1 two-component system, chemotaxis family, sensor kinase CheA [Acidaminobacter hydrogenoformans DSM 2784]
MPGTYENEAMLEVYIFEAVQILDQLEQTIMHSEREGTFGEDAVNEIFRCMHTVKGASAMMMFHNITTIAHTMEDIFFFLREHKPENVDHSTLSDLVLDCVDFIKVEVNKIKNHDAPDGDPGQLVKRLEAALEELRSGGKGTVAVSRDTVAQDTEVQDTEVKTPTDEILEAAPEQEPSVEREVAEAEGLYAYKAKLYFQEDCGMEHIRAYGVIHELTELAEELFHCPQALLESAEAAEVIRKQGFELFIRTKADMAALKARLEKTVFLEQLILGYAEEPNFETHCMHQDDIHWLKPPGDLLAKEAELQEGTGTDRILSDQPQMNHPPQNASAINLEVAARSVPVPNQTTGAPAQKVGQPQNQKQTQSQTQNQSATMISVSVDKLDGLMNLVGELVIAEAMVTQSPDVLALESDHFHKAARQLHKITGDLQDMVMSIRMVPLSTTFVKMHRIVRDMSKKLDKQVVLDLAGEETEVDKNIIERISDPLMHLIRNAIDHGIEDEAERLERGKDKVGRISLEAKNAGSDVLIVLKDDGRGLNKAKIMEKARQNGLLTKPEQDMSDREIYSLILRPGFSTKEQVTEFSGRGVGMDVVAKNLEAVGGAVHIESQEGHGTTMTLKIPLTLAIIEGMNIRVGASRFTLPITSIKESFKPSSKDCHTDPDGNEMVMVRGRSYPILRMHKHFGLKNTETVLADGILIMVEDEHKEICLFADELMGQQQVVVKALPNYIKSMKKILGLAGCTLLGDGSISLILDVGGLAGLRIR